MAQMLLRARRPRFAGGGIASTPASPFIAAFLLTFASLLAAVVFTTLLAKHVGQVSLSDPFIDYADIFPGQRTDVESLSARGFRCGLDSLPPAAYLLERCELSFQTGVISSVNLSIWDGRVVRLNFVAREGALSIGDLTLLWGRPDFQVYDQHITLYWPERHIKGLSGSETEPFSYFQPILQISFG